MNPLINQYGQPTAKSPIRFFEPIDNYIYLYHTDTLIILPVFPDTISDKIDVEFQATSALTSPAPIFSYSKSGPRTIDLTFQVHRDMINQVNLEKSKLVSSIPSLLDEKGNYNEDYVDVMIKQLQSIALPRYGASEKKVNPPMVAVRIGNTVFCKGIVTGSVGVTYETPVLSNGKYALARIQFSVTEVDPYDADTVAKHGSFRGFSLDLERQLLGQAKSSSARSGNYFHTAAISN